MRTIKKYDDEAVKLSAAIKVLEEMRSRVWRKRDKLFCKLEKR